MEKIFVFDLDGTLVDSMPYFAKGMTSVLDDENISYDYDEIVKTVTPLGYTKGAQFYKTLGVKASVDDMVAKINERLVFEYTNNVKLKPGVEAYLNKIHSEGGRLFVLTASPHSVTDACLKANGVFDLFEKVWSVEDFSLSKSDTRIFHAVARYIGCAENDVNYFDDNLTAVTNSKKAGYKVFGVLDRQDEGDVAKIKQLCDVFVESFTLF